MILEDDAYHGLGFHQPAPPPVGAHAPDLTVTLWSASKMFAPGLRICWLGAPAWLAPTLALLKQTLDLHSSTLDQLVVAELLRDGVFLRTHLDTIRARNATRADALVTALDGVVATRVPQGGMFCWGTAGVDTRAALPRAIAAGVAYVPGDACTVGRDGRHTLRLSFATLAPADLRTAADRLRAAFRSP